MSHPVHTPNWVEMMSSVLVFAVLAVLLVGSEGFAPSGVRRFGQSGRTSLQMFEVEMGPTTYAALAVVTLLPSLAFVKFVGDAADSSRDNLSEETKAQFKRSMMDQPGANLALPTSEEEALKKAVAKAYMQDKDVDVAVLEEKLRKRASWRKEMMAQQKAGMVDDMEDEDGW